MQAGAAPWTGCWRPHWTRWKASARSRGNTAAVIGPTISQRAYEVGPEFFDDFMGQDDAYARFFTNGEGDRYLFDLPGLGLHKLRQAGIGAAEWSRHCTYSDAGEILLLPPRNPRERSRLRPPDLLHPALRLPVNQLQLWRILN